MPAKKRRGKAVTGKGRKLGWEFVGYARHGRKRVKKYVAIVRENQNARVLAVREGRKRYWVVEATKYGMNQSVYIPVEEPGEYVVRAYCVVGKRRKLIRRGFHNPPLTEKKEFTVVTAKEKVVKVKTKGKGKKRKKTKTYRYFYVQVMLPWFSVLRREGCPSDKVMLVIEKAPRETKKRRKDAGAVYVDDGWMLTDYGDWGGYGYEDYDY